jgi:DNA-binding CsgD family transcriptional regulator
MAASSAFPFRFSPRSVLTLRKREIIEQVVRGKTTQEIADYLFISPKTVIFHLSQLYDWSGEHNRLKLIIRLIESGDLLPDVPVYRTIAGKPNSLRLK